MPNEETADRAVEVDYRYRQRRFDLVKIAFKEALISQRESKMPSVTGEYIAKEVVAYADVVLAAMEKGKADTDERKDN